MATKISDVAKKADVSVSTVSLIINEQRKGKKTRIGESTREKVLRIAKEMDYIPNLYARSIRQQSTYTVGMIATNILHPSVSLIIEGAKAQANKQGYQIILGVSSDDEQQEKRYVDNFLSRRVDGLIVLPTPSGETINDLENLYAKGYPMVLCESATTADMDTVMADVEMGAYNAVEYLVKLGHKKIAFCAGHSQWLSARFKFHGYRRALEDCQLNIRDEFYVKVALSNYHAGRQGAQQILELKDKPSAVLFHNDTMAAGAIDYFLESGIKVPEEISVIGFNDIPLAASLKIPLTTMRSPLLDIGHRAATTVLERILQKKDKLKGSKTVRAPVSIRFTPELIVRSSCTRKKGH